MPVCFELWMSLCEFYLANIYPISVGWILWNLRFPGMGCTFDDPGIFIDGGPNRRGNSITRGPLLAGGCGCFRDFLKSTAVFWRNWSLKQKFYGKTLVKLFCCEFMLIIVCIIILFIFSVTLGKLTHFATDSAPHQPADPWDQSAPNRQGSDETLEAEFSILPRDARCVNAMAC